MTSNLALPQYPEFAVPVAAVGANFEHLLIHKVGVAAHLSMVKPLLVALLQIT